MSDIRDMLMPGAPRDDGPPDTPALDLDKKLPLASPQMWTRGFFIVCGVVVAIAFFILREMTTTLEMTLPWAAWLAPVAALAVAVIIRRILVPSSNRVIRFGPDEVTLPGGRNSRRTFDVAYENIRAIVPLVSRGQPALVIETLKKTHVFVASDFPHPEHWRILWAQLMDRISRRPGADEQLQQMRRLAGLSQQASSIKARFTRYLLYLVAVIFGAQVFLSPDVDVLEFLYFGANSQIMVLQEGQWWRVVTANLLHGNLVHFGVNAFALFFLGTYCERLFGESRTVVLILATALAGATASLMGTEAMFAVGISTALFGLLGAYFALHLRFGKELPPPYRQSWLWWGVILGLNGVLSFAVPIIDAWGHLGGFVAGVGLGLVMTIGVERFQPNRPSGTWTNLIAAGLIALFAASTVLAVGYGLGDHPDDEIRFAQALEQRADEQEPALLVQVVHQWSQHTPRPDGLNPILVNLAEQAHERSDDLFMEWRAAAAMIRLAEEMDDPFDRDIMQRGILRFEQSAADHGDQSVRRALARLLTEFVGDVGPLHAVNSPFERAESVDDQLRLMPEGEVSAPRRVYVLALSNGDEASGQVVFDRCIPEGLDTGAELIDTDRPLQPEWTLELAMVTGAATCPEERAAIWRSTEVTAPASPP